MSFFNFKVSWISDKQANSQNMYDPEYKESNTFSAVL